MILKKNKQTSKFTQAKQAIATFNRMVYHEKRNSSEQYKTNAGKI